MTPVTDATPVRRPPSTRLLEFFGEVSPELDRPDWLAPFATELECAVPANGNTGEVFVVVAAPPQHGKTELILRAFLFWDHVCPGKRHAYVTYNDDRTQAVARTFALICLSAGIDLRGTQDEPILPNGSRIKFTSIGGSFTGYPVDGVCVVDDPIKGPKEAASQTTRRFTVQWFDTTAFARRHPGTSFVVMATRWHKEDLSGVLIERGWRYINLKAIAEGPVNDNGQCVDDPLGRAPGESLWPQRKPPEFFRHEQKNPQAWRSLFQGDPQPIGGTVFVAPPAYYRRLPVAGYRGAFGLDLAYTAKTSNDWSVCIEGWWYDGDADLPAGLYVVDVLRKQVDAPSFALSLKAKKSARPGWRMRWYAAGTERGSADFLKGAGIPINIRQPIGDKRTRATAGRFPVIGGWNGLFDEESQSWGDQQIFLPDPDCFDAPWLLDFLQVIQNFTGTEKTERDDDVDALTALWDELRQPDIVTNAYSRSRSVRGQLPRPRE